MYDAKKHRGTECYVSKLYTEVDYILVRGKFVRCVANTFGNPGSYVVH